jgi:hypothetical protein
MTDNEIIIYTSLVEKNICVGNRWFHSRKGRENVFFEYDAKWLQHPEKFALEPALQNHRRNVSHTSKYEYLWCHRRFCTRSMGTHSYASKRKFKSKKPK